MAKRKEDAFEEEPFGDEPELGEPEEQPEELAEPMIPDAAVVFDAAMADEWLAKGQARLRNVFTSVRFEPAGMPDNKLEFLLLMAAQSIMGKYRLARPIREGKGIIFVPKVLAGAPVFDAFVRGEDVGEYTSFSRI